MTAEFKSGYLIGILSKIRFRIFFFAVALFVCGTLTAQHHLVTGSVLDEKGQPLAGASVMVKGTKIGTVCDADGVFSLSIPEGGALEIAFIGYKTTVLNPGIRDNLEILMEPESESIDDVVVVAYATQKKESVVGAISAIGGKDLIKSPTGDIGTALTGRLPGLTTVQSSGQPGGALPDIRIRGQGGVLVIVDGIERQGGSRLGDADATLGNLSGWESINPQDIESVSILKDASATAVYGVRGANGVIIITTKSGRAGKPKVQYNGSFSLSCPTLLQNPVNSADYIMYTREGNYNDGIVSSGQYAYDSYLKYKYNYDPILYPSLNINDYLLRSLAPKHEHNVSVQGGDNVVRYFASAGFYSEDGIIKNLSGFEQNPNQHYDRFSLRSNLDFNVTKNLILGIKMDMRFENRGGVSGFGQEMNATDNRFWQNLYLSKPWITPGFDEHGRYIQTNLPEAGSTEMIDFIRKSGVYTLKQTTLNNIIFARYNMGNLIEGLSLQAKYAFDFYAFNNHHRIPNHSNMIYYEPIEGEDGLLYRQLGQPHFLGYQNLSNGKYKKDYFEASVNYAQKFNKHDVTGLLLFNMDKRAYNLPAPADVPRSYLGYVGRLTYGYDEKYLAEFNIGVNGSENFPEDKRYGIFPAFSLGWVISEEKFMRPVEEYISFLKLRASYGSVGSDSGGGRFLYIPGTYSYFPATNDAANNPNGFYANFGDQNRNYHKALREGTVANPDVTWATAIKANFGIESKFFNDKLSLEIDYFKEFRKDIITQMQNMPSYLYPTSINPGNNMGFQEVYSVMTNYNRTSTQGFEVVLGWKQILKNFSYYATFSYSYAVTDLVRISEPTYAYPWMYGQGLKANQVRGLVADGYWTSWEEINDPSNPYNTFGNDPVPGDIKYKDINGDMKIDSNDVVPLGYGNSYPPSNFALDAGFTWGGFSLSLLFQGATGMNFFPSNTLKILMGSGKAIFDMIEDRWTPANTDATYPVLHAPAKNVETASNFINSSYWKIDATYIRLKNAVISYSIPDKLLRKSPFSGVSVSLSGQNILTWKKDPRMKYYDPEQVSTGRTRYPLMQIYSLGLNLTF